MRNRKPKKKEEQYNGQENQKKDHTMIYKTLHKIPLKLGM